MKNFFFFILLSLLVSGCSNPDEDFANRMCSCMKESGLKSGLSQRGFIRSFDGDGPCFEEIGKEIYEKLKGMNNSQRADFMKQFSKALLETDCADIAFNLIPYDDLIKDMGRKFDDDDNSSFFNSSSVDVCDCINMPSNPSDRLKADCKKLEQEWAEKYENADDLEKEKMMEQFKDCEKNK